MARSRRLTRPFLEPHSCSAGCLTPPSGDGAWLCNEPNFEQGLPRLGAEQSVVDGALQCLEFVASQGPLLDIVATWRKCLELVWSAQRQRRSFVRSLDPSSGTGDDLVAEMVGRSCKIDVYEREVRDAEIVVHCCVPRMYGLAIDDDGGETWEQRPDDGDCRRGIAVLRPPEQRMQGQVVSFPNRVDESVEVRLPSSDGTHVCSEPAGAGGVDGGLAVAGVLVHRVTVSAGRHGSVPGLLPGSGSTWCLPVVSRQRP